jgi:hypothetical protein
MAGFLRLLLMPSVPTYVMTAAWFPLVRRLPVAGPLSRYRFGALWFASRDLGM